MAQTDRTEERFDHLVKIGRVFSSAKKPHSIGAGMMTGFFVGMGLMAKYPKAAGRLYQKMWLMMPPSARSDAENLMESLYAPPLKEKI